MLLVLITIIVVAILLFISSFFMSDKIKQLEEQFEQFSIATMQDTYQLKKKVKILEEELLMNEPAIETTTNEIPNHLKNKPLLIQKIHHLYEQGYSLDDISQDTNLSIHDVQTILNHHM